MSTSLSSHLEAQRRKRVRKGTKSCWECKRRKVKCIFPPGNASICTACLERTAPCLSQEYVDTQSPRDNVTSELGERMVRVEGLLERLINSSPHAPEIGDSAPRPVLNSHSSSTLSTASNGFEGAHAVADIAMPMLDVPSITSHVIPNSIGDARLERKIESIRKQLAALLPDQGDVSQLRDLSNGWWLVQRHIFPHLDATLEHEHTKTFDVASVSRSHPVVIGRLLLIIAICIQQLPSDAARKLRTKTPLQEMMETNVSIASDSLTSSDDLTGSLEGVECLVLQGLYHGNAGNFRRAVLAFRRAINVANLMGMHKPIKPSSEALSVLDTRRYRLWHLLLRGERYFSLILGIPSATGTMPCYVDDRIGPLPPEEIYNQHLCDISGRILARNQDDQVHLLSATYEIDAKLDLIAKEMTPDWWHIPSNIVGDRTDLAHSQFERVMCQVWHYELRILLHLPFMLCKSADRRYEYSRVSCLNACRGLIQRWIFIRGEKSSTLFNNLIEFQAFTSVTTLLLGLLDPMHITSRSADAMEERDSDLQLAENVVRILEGLKSSGAGVQLVNQSISAIRRLQGVVRGEHGPSGNLRLEIPHFGTINITRSGFVESAEGVRLLDAERRLEDIPREVTSLPRASMPASSISVASVAPTGLSRLGMASQNNWDINYTTYGIGNRDANMSQNAIFQFWNNPIPNLGPLTEEASASHWPSGENEVMSFDSLLNSDMYLY